jgi:hypothetical protein
VWRAVIKGVLTIFGKSWKNVICLIGDNWNVNKALAEKCKIPLVGCAAHRLNLAVEKYLEVGPTAALIQKVHELMTKARTSKIRGELRLSTPLVPKSKCTTRWTGTLEMVKRYFEMEAELKAIPALKDLLLLKKQVAALKVLREKLDKMFLVMKALQRENITMCQVRVLFDGLLRDFPKMEHYLSPTSDFIHSATFESAVVQLQTGGELSASHKSHLVKLLIDAETPQKSGSEEELNYVDSLLSQFDVGKAKGLYMDTEFICPTSVLVESIFSRAGHIWTDRRASTSPVHVEQQMFLCINRHLWDQTSVQALLHQ